MADTIIAKFTQGEASNHRLPAYEGSQSIEGIARSIQLVGHFLVTGSVRRRYPFSDDLRLFITPPRAGSFDAIFEIITSPTALAIGGGLASGITGNLLTDFLKLTFRRAIGQSDPKVSSTVEKIEEARPGDTDALVDAIEPSVRRAHSVINHGAGNVVIISGSDNLVKFDAVSKRYIETSHTSDEDETLAVSIGSFNVNSG